MVYSQPAALHSLSLSIPTTTLMKMKRGLGSVLLYPSNQRVFMIMKTTKTKIILISNGIYVNVNYNYYLLTINDFFVYNNMVFI